MKWRSAPLYKRYGSGRTLHLYDYQLQAESNVQAKPPHWYPKIIATVADDAVM